MSLGLHIELSLLNVGRGRVWVRRWMLALALIVLRALEVTLKAILVLVGCHVESLRAMHRSLRHVMLLLLVHLASVLTRLLLLLRLPVVEVRALTRLLRLLALGIVRSRLMRTLVMSNRRRRSELMLLRLRLLGLRLRLSEVLGNQRRRRRRGARGGHVKGRRWWLGTAERGRSPSCVGQNWLSRLRWRCRLRWR